MNLLLLLTMSLIAPNAPDSPGAYIPWEEFQRLYRNQIEQEFHAQNPTPAPIPMLYSLDDAQYKLNIQPGRTRGEVQLTGKILSGNPEPIPLFGPDTVIAELPLLTGGALLAAQGDQPIRFLPETGAAAFQITAVVLLTPKSENSVKSVSMDIPPALRNALTLVLPAEYRLQDLPGTPDANGAFHFPATPRLTVRYRENAAPAGESIIEIDTLSRIQVQNKRILITTGFLPIRTPDTPLVLLIPAGADLLASSLNASAITKLEPNRFQITLPPQTAETFSIDTVLEWPAETNEVSLLLPEFEGNRGQQGRFVVEEPDNGQLTASGESLVSQIPVERLGEALEPFAPKHAAYMSLPAHTPLRLALREFEAVSAPAIVLDNQYFFSSIEENGSILSVLVMDIPPEMGTRMAMNAIPDGEVWSLTVNDVQKSLYTEKQGQWVIPLDKGKTSHVELALLRKGSKLGLQGAVETVLPQTGLASRELRVGIAIPERLELLSLEGPVRAAQNTKWTIPANFVGKPYFFAQSFYKGEGAVLSMAYKEPVKQQSEKTGVEK